MSSAKRLAVLGGSGRLGAALTRAYAADFQVSSFDRTQLDVGDFEQVRRSLDALEFDTLINCAAQTNVDRCETHREEAFALNGDAPGLVAEICARKGAKMIHISTDYVFDGEKRQPYTEDDAAEPISVYGASKLAGEERVLAADSGHAVVRVSWVFGPDRPSFIDAVIKRARAEEHVDAVADKWSAPSYTIDIATMLRPLITDRGTAGLFHISNAGECSWQEYAQWAIDCCHAAGVPLKGRRIEALRLKDMTNFIARRPPYTVLSPARLQRISGLTIRHWREAVADYVQSFVARRD